MDGHHARKAWLIFISCIYAELSVYWILSLHFRVRKIYIHSNSINFIEYIINYLRRRKFNTVSYRQCLWYCSCVACVECNCDLLGSEHTDEVCDHISGQCPCRPNVVGQTCNKCGHHHWKIASGEGCEACDCDPIGSTAEQCNEVGGLIIFLFYCLLYTTNMIKTSHKYIYIYIKLKIL